MANPTLPRGPGAKRSGSFAKKVLSITNTKIDKTDPPGMLRTSIDAQAMGAMGIWDNLPASPNPSPIMCYHHGFDFSKPVQVDTTKTWTQTAVAAGAGAQPLMLQNWAGYDVAHAIIQTGDAAGDLYQYQERYFAYYPQVSYKRDLWFYIALRGGAAGEQIYIGYTPISATAIASRQYGLGFFYDDSAQKWYFKTENLAHTTALELGDASADWLALGLHWHWRKTSGADVTVLFGDEVQDVIHTGDNLILNQTLSLTLGIKAITAHNALLGFRHMDEVIEK